MTRSIAGIIFDLALLPAIWLCGRSRIILFILLAAGNILCYLVLLTMFLHKTGKQEERKGHTLEFVLIQFFLCAGIFLFKLANILIEYDCR